MLRKRRGVLSVSTLLSIRVASCPSALRLTPGDSAAGSASGPAVVAAVAVRSRLIANAMTRSTRSTRRPALQRLRTAWRAAAKKQVQHLERRIKQSQGLEGRKPQRLLVEGHRVGTASPGAERSNEGVSERAAPFLNSYHGCENLLLAFHNENLDL